MVKQLKAQREKGAVAIPVVEPVKFAHYLNAMVQGMRGKRSGKLTRLKLMAATTELLEDRLFSEINVIDICECAAVAKGTFYLQFQTKEEVINAVLGDYVDFEVQTMPVLSAENEPFLNTRAIVAWYEMTFRVNAGLMRNFVRLSDEDAPIANLWKRRNERIVERSFVPYLLHSGFDAQNADIEIARLALRTLGGVMDYAMFARHGIHDASDFTSGFSEESLIDLHAVLMHRALYGESPAAEFVSEPTRQFLLKGKRANAVQAGKVAK